MRNQKGYVYLPIKTNKQKKTNMKAAVKKLTVQETRDHRQNEYNYSIWQSNVDRMLKYSDVEFYVSEKGMDGAYDYDRMYVVYTLPTGTRYLKSFGYSAMLSNGGLGEALIYPTQSDSQFVIETGKVQLSDGRRVYIDGSGNEKYIQQRSILTGTIWTKEL